MEVDSEGLSTKSVCCSSWLSLGFVLEDGGSVLAPESCTEGLVPQLVDEIGGSLAGISEPRSIGFVTTGSVSFSTLLTLSLPASSAECSEEDGALGYLAK